MVLENAAGRYLVLLPVKSGTTWTIVDDGQEHLLSTVWTLTNGYVKESRGRRRYLHRLLTDAGPGEVVDHKNGNRLDNRMSNLRVCDKRRNALNAKKRSSTTTTNTSAHKGVYRKRHYWVARVKLESGKIVELSPFTLEEDAARAYDFLANRYYGEFARLNFPNQPLLTETALRSRARQKRGKRGRLLPKA